MEKHTLFKMLMIALCITFSISTVYGSSLQGEPTTGHRTKRIKRYIE